MGRRVLPEAGKKESTRVYMMLTGIIKPPDRFCGLVNSPIGLHTAQ